MGPMAFQGKATATSPSGLALPIKGAYWILNRQSGHSELFCLSLCWPLTILLQGNLSKDSLAPKLDCRRTKVQGGE